MFHTIPKSHSAFFTLAPQACFGSSIKTQTTGLHKLKSCNPEQPSSLATHEGRHRSLDRQGTVLPSNSVTWGVA